MTRYLTEEEIEQILDFIVPRQGIPICIEEPIYKRKKEDLKNQLVKIKIYPILISKLKKELEKQYYTSLITPGESVGIISAQSMGEFSTQATLNTFHAAGLETGIKVTDGISRFQELINASKNRDPKIETLTIYFKEKFTLRELKQLNIVEVFVRMIVKDIFVINDCSFYDLFIELYGGNKEICDTICIKCILNMDNIYKYKIHFYKLKQQLETAFPIFCVYGKDLLYIYGKNVEEIINNFLNYKICGIENVLNCFYHKNNQNEWYVTTEGGSIKSIIKSSISSIVNFHKTISSSVWDILDILGIEATRKFYKLEMKKIMEGVNDCHINLLVDYMTFTSSIKATNRYTMRGEQNTFNKIAFEEPFETVIRAAEFNKGEDFTGVSASIIFGKKVKVGTYAFDLEIDLNKLTPLKYVD
ncbi:DNA-directed RNA polymerase subunit A'' [Spirochaetia bacterium]|nr:DNA-directed RNA polymerase subunit A'' [Spirochaetia bacterium]